MVVVPEVKHVGTTAAGLSFLVSDYLSLEAGVSPDELGKSIALMHLAEPDVSVLPTHAEHLTRVLCRMRWPRRATLAFLWTIHWAERRSRMAGWITGWIFSENAVCDINCA